MTISAIIVIGGLGLFFGIILSYAGEKLKVFIDPKIEKIREALPGANCGGCGYTGCDPFAEAVVKQEAKPSGCPVGGGETTENICAILGVEPTTEAPKTAYIKCGGNCNNSINEYNYDGIIDCNIAVQLAGDTPKTCKYGCLGLTSCSKVCEFDAINIVNGVAVVDKDKCVACGACISQCPKSLIDIIPTKSTVHVSCNSNDKGVKVKKGCQVGCIGCGLCVKACKFDAIHVDNFIASIDYDKCVLCTLCVKKCPTSAIILQKKKIVEKNINKDVEASGDSNKTTDTTSTPKKNNDKSKKKIVEK